MCEQNRTRRVTMAHITVCLLAEGCSAIWMMCVHSGNLGHDGSTGFFLIKCYLLSSLVISC